MHVQIPTVVGELQNGMGGGGATSIPVEYFFLQFIPCWQRISKV